MNVFYQEILVTADPDRGISFTSCLMVLAHYNVINDTKSLRLEEFLRRRARLQRVHESIRRNVVIGFFDTMFWSRRFRREQNLRKNYRMAAPPQIPVPEIFVDDPDDTLGESEGTEPRDFTTPTTMPSPRHMTRSSVSSGFNARGLPPIDTTLRRRDSPTRGGYSDSPDLSPSATPGQSPSRMQSLDTFYQGPDRTPSPVTPRLGHSREGSAVSNLSAQGVLESFDSSAWGESIRRSFTMRRPRSQNRR